MDQLVEILGLHESNPRFRALYERLAATEAPEQYVIEGKRTTNFRGAGISLDISEGVVVSWVLYLMQAPNWKTYSGTLPLGVDRRWSAEGVIDQLGAPLRDTTMRLRRMQYTLLGDLYVWFVFNGNGEMTRVHAATRASVPHLAV